MKNLQPKRFFTCLLFLIACTYCGAQEWMTSLEVAKRLALLQDKMLLVMWEESTEYDFPIIYQRQGSIMRVTTDLFEDEQINQMIWENFVPVVLFESNYSDLFKEIKDSRSNKYIERFQDDGIKIMDVNGNILNTGYFNTELFNFSNFVKRYGLNTSFLRGQLTNYIGKKNFNTTLALAYKYLDYAIFVSEAVRAEIVAMSTIYFDEAKALLARENIENKAGYMQKFELIEFRKELTLDKPRRVLRQLKKMDTASIHPINESLYAFLHYTANMMLGDESKAAIWKSKVSLVDLKKAELIININRN